ncbi:DUF1592 domain-containing protein [Aureliella helgolandensis]|uniref:Planctomycete cytochrome C n=1 Tax=Aureliella helgolandensis TaxID=2527968 RepID=A0A518G0K9_9BACT|nr:DUF1592 domain-containing protein [Aureliella helgolandensis]QDV22070.1 Planctomycete cytochrome C [Aureliella helgolandensis]
MTISSDLSLAKILAIVLLKRAIVVPLLCLDLHRIRCLTFVVLGGAICPVNPPAEAAEARVTRGVQVLYTFDQAAGVDHTKDVVRDLAGVASPIDLKIENPNSVRWSSGGLTIVKGTTLRSIGSTQRLADSLVNSGSLTLEAWITPANDRQKGPARIVSMSTDANQRNLTLGQDQNRYEVRLRSSTTSSNGIPSLVGLGGSALNKRTHVVYTLSKQGQAKLYVNGEQEASKRLGGNISNWNGNFPLLLANEANGNRPWLGELHLVAIYQRALSVQEIRQNFQADGGKLDPELLAMELESQRPAVDPRTRDFEVHIAPLLSKHCLDCHGTTTKEGGLDLSLRAAAMAGGESGNTIVPGKPEESLLWEQVAAGDMPPEGEPLADAEKQLLRKWLSEGAIWSGEMIDQALYAKAGSKVDVFVQRLTVDEYIETVRAAVGIDIEAEARRMLPRDLRADGFTNTAYNLNVDLKHVEAYAQLANLIVDRLDIPKFASRFTKKQTLNTDASARDFVESMGEWLLRGPLTKREEVLYSGIGTTVASAGGSFEEGVALMIEAMLQSPRFIYRIEDQRGEERIGEYEMASRLSYIIWGGPPDPNLMQAASSGQLGSRQQIQKQAERMLTDPRAVRRSELFVSNWLDVDRLANMQPDAERFPQWNAELAADMRAESLAFFREIVWTQKRPLSDLFNAKVTFATPRLAELYGLEPKGAGLQRYDVSDVPSRGGLLTQGSLLTIGGDGASMVTRGLFVLNDVLRGAVGEPPPGLDLTPVPSRPGLSQRTVAEMRIAADSCGGCHTKFEPLAFGLEQFDGIGARHESDEYGNALREDGEVLFPGNAKAVKYKSSAELMDLLATSERVRETVTWKVAQFAIGRPLVASDAQQIREIHQESQRNGGTYQSLMTAIVSSELVMRQRSQLSAID